VVPGESLHIGAVADREMTIGQTTRRAGDYGEMSDTDLPAPDLTPAAHTRSPNPMISSEASPVSSAEVAQADPEAIDEMSPELVEELPPSVLDDLREGRIDTIPDSVVERLPKDVADGIPDALVAGASSNPLLTVVLLAVGVMSVLGAVWGVIKGLIKLAILLAVVAAGAWIWYFSR